MVGGDWRLVVGDWRLVVGDWWLVIGGWQRLAVVGGWRVAAGQKEEAACTPHPQSKAAKHGCRPAFSRGGMRGRGWK